MARGLEEGKRMLVPLWEDGYEPKGRARVFLFRAVEQRLTETLGLGDGFYRPWKEILVVDGRYFFSTGEAAKPRLRAGEWHRRLTTKERFQLATLLVRTAAGFEAKGIRLGPLRPEAIYRWDDGFGLEDPFLAALLLPHRPGWRLFPDLCFRAPESIREGQETAMGDRFALGATLYWLFTGFPPFFDPDERYLSTRVLYERPMDPRYLFPPLPAAAAKAILDLLAKHPGERPAPREMVALFAQDTPGEEIRRWCRARARLPAPRRPSGEGRPWRWVGIAAGLLFSAFLALHWIGGGRHAASPSLTAAADDINYFYRLKNEGDYARLVTLLGPAVYSSWPPGATAVWDEVLGIRFIRGAKTLQAVVYLREKAFVRGKIRTWSGEEVVSLVARGGRWQIVAVTRPAAKPR